MALKDMFSAMRHEGYVVAPLDRYLFDKANEPNDRAIDVNAPSQMGKCLRHNYYMRKQYLSDGGIDPRSQRIFDNGSGVHERLQTYLLDMELLIMDEVPLLNEKYNIQGHTDGFLALDPEEVGILEIKSINDNGFQKLHDAKEEHKKQGLVYLYCAEERRKFLREAYSTETVFNMSYQHRYDYYEKHYQHMKGGRKYTREQKIHNEVMLNMLSDNVLWHTERPITKVVFLYENKNDQSLKEFVLERGIVTEPILTEILKDCEYLNKCCRTDTLPPRIEGATKTCYDCKWCEYKNECYVQ